MKLNINEHTRDLNYLARIDDLEKALIEVLDLYNTDNLIPHPDLPEGDTDMVHEIMVRAETVLEEEEDEL